MSSLGQESQRLKVYALSRDVDHGDGVKEYGPLGNLASIASDGSSEIGGNDETKRQAENRTSHKRRSSDQGVGGGDGLGVSKAEEGVGGGSKLHVRTSSRDVATILRSSSKEGSARERHDETLRHVDATSANKRRLRSDGREDGDADKIREEDARSSSGGKDSGGGRTQKKKHDQETTDRSNEEKSKQPKKKIKSQPPAPIKTLNHYWGTAAHIHPDNLLCDPRFRAHLPQDVEVPESSPWEEDIVVPDLFSIAPAPSVGDVTSNEVDDDHVEVVPQRVEPQEAAENASQNVEDVETIQQEAVVQTSESDVAAQAADLSTVFSRQEKQEEEPQVAMSMMEVDDDEDKAENGSGQDAPTATKDGLTRDKVEAGSSFSAMEVDKEDRDDKEDQGAIEWVVTTRTESRSSEAVTSPPPSSPIVKRTKKRAAVIVLSPPSSPPIKRSKLIEVDTNSPRGERPSLTLGAKQTKIPSKQTKISGFFTLKSKTQRHATQQHATATPDVTPMDVEVDEATPAGESTPTPMEVDATPDQEPATIDDLECDLNKWLGMGFAPTHMLEVAALSLAESASFAQAAERSAAGHLASSSSNGIAGSSWFAQAQAQMLALAEPEPEAGTPDTGPSTSSFTESTSSITTAVQAVISWLCGERTGELLFELFDHLRARHVGCVGVGLCAEVEKVQQFDRIMQDVESSSSSFAIKAIKACSAAVALLNGASWMERELCPLENSKGKKGRSESDEEDRVDYLVEALRDRLSTTRLEYELQVARVSLPAGYQIDSLEDDLASEEKIEVPTTTTTCVEVAGLSDFEAIHRLVQVGGGQPGVFSRPQLRQLRTSERPQLGQRPNENDIQAFDDETEFEIIQEDESPEETPEETSEEMSDVTLDAPVQRQLAKFDLFSKVSNKKMKASNDIEQIQALVLADLHNQMGTLSSNAIAFAKEKAVYVYQRLAAHSSERFKVVERSRLKKRGAWMGTSWMHVWTLDYDESTTADTIARPDNADKDFPQQPVQVLVAMMYDSAPSSVKRVLERLEAFDAHAFNASAANTDFYGPTAYVDFALGQSVLHSARDTNNQIIYCRWHGDARYIGSARYGKERQRFHDAALEVRLVRPKANIKEPVNQMLGEYMRAKPVNQMLGEYMRANDLVGRDFGAGVICAFGNESSSRPLPTQNALEHLFVALGGTTEVDDRIRIQVNLLDTSFKLMKSRRTKRTDRHMRVETDVIWSFRKLFPIEQELRELLSTLGME